MPSVSDPLIISQLSSLQRYLLALCAGALVPLTLSPVDLWPLSLLSTALLYVLLLGTTPRAAGSIGWWFGFGMFGVGASWVYVSIADFGNAPPLLAGLLTLAFVAGLALLLLLQCWCFRRFASATLPLLGFAVCWSLGEWIRTWFLTGFPWLYLGYAHVSTPLAGLAPLFGVLGTGFVVALAGALLGACALHLYRQRSIPALLSTWMPLALLVLLSAAVGTSSLRWVDAVPDRALSVALVQANIAQDLKFDEASLYAGLQRYADLSAPLWQHDLVLWPETAIPLVYQQAGPILDSLNAVALENDSTLVSGIFWRDGTSIHNSLTAVGNGSGIWHKQKLVPFGEYVPLRDLLANLLELFALPMSSLVPGPADQGLMTAAGLSFAPFICYEVVYPEFVRRHAQDADFLLTVSNDTWFGASWGPPQHLQMAAMRALENGRYMLRATNNGISALIDEKGRILSRTAQFEAATLTGSVQIFTGNTPWSIWGNWPLLLLSFAVLMLNLYSQRRPLREASKVSE